MKTHHLEEYNAVVLANHKGVPLATFTAHHRESRVRELIGNSSSRESADTSPATADATPNAGNAAGAALHEGSMARLSELHKLFLDTAAEPAGQLGGQPFSLVETTRTSIPDAVAARSSLLGNPSHVLPCRTFVLSSRSSGCC